MPSNDLQATEDNQDFAQTLSNHGCVIGFLLLLVSFPLLIYFLKGVFNMHAKNPGLAVVCGLIGILLALGGLYACLRGLADKNKQSDSQEKNRTVESQDTNSNED